MVDVLALFEDRKAKRRRRLVVASIALGTAAAAAAAAWWVGRKAGQAGRAQGSETRVRVKAREARDWEDWTEALEPS